MDSHLICCLCNFQASTDLDLESHIDNSHSDIFKASNPTVVKVGGDSFIQNQAQPYQSPTQAQIYQTQMSSFQNQNEATNYQTPTQNPTYQVQSTGSSYEIQTEAPTYEILTEAPTYQSQTEATTFDIQTEATYYQSEPQTQGLNFQSNDRATTPSYQSHTQVQTYYEPKASQAYYQPPLVSQTRYLTSSSNSNHYVQPQTRVAASSKPQPQTRVAASSKPEHQSKEVQKISASYNDLLSHPSFQCPHCGFFSPKADVLQNHIGQKHPKEQNRYPSPQSRVQSQIQASKYLVQSSTSSQKTYNKVKTGSVKTTFIPEIKQKDQRQSLPLGFDKVRKNTAIANHKESPIRPALVSIKKENMNIININQNTFVNRVKFIQPSAIGPKKGDSRPTFTIMPPANRDAPNRVAVQPARVQQTANTKKERSMPNIENQPSPTTAQGVQQVSNNQIKLVQTGAQQFSFQFQEEFVQSSPSTNYKRNFHTADVVEPSVLNSNNNNFKKIKQDVAQDQENCEVAVYLQTINDLKTELERIKKQKSQLESDFKKLEVKVRSEHHQKLDNEEHIKVELDKTKAEFVQTLVEFEQTKIELEQSTAELEQSKAEAEQCRSDYQQIINQYEESNTNLQQYQVYYEQNYAQHQETNQQLDQAKTDLSQIRTELTLTFQKLQEAKKLKDKCESELKKMQDENKKLKKVEDENRKLKKVEDENRKLAKSNEKYLKELNDIISAKKKLELLLSDLSLQYQSKDQELNNLSLNMSNIEASYQIQCKKVEEQEQEVSQLKDNLYNYSNIIMAKNASISQMKVSEERQTLETNKLKKDLKEIEDLKQSCMASVECYAAIKSTLEEVFQGDAKFCHTMMNGENFSDLTELEICQMVEFMLKDYIADRKAHMGELEQCMKKMNQLKATSYRFNNSLIELNGKFNAQASTLNRKHEELKQMSKKLEAIEMDKSSELNTLLIAIKDKNEKIAQLEKEVESKFNLVTKLQGKVSKIKEDVKGKQTVKELKCREKELTSKITALNKQIQDQETLILTLERITYVLERNDKKKANSDINNSIVKNLEGEVERAKAEVKAKEKEYNEKVQNFLIDLDKMKIQVTQTMTQKEQQIVTINQQLLSKEVLFTHLRKELDAKSKKIKNLEAVIKATRVKNDPV